MYLGILASASFTLFVAFVIFSYRWMDSVRDNHLAHIQSAVERTAEEMTELNKAIAVHDAHTEDYHAEQVRLIAGIKK